MLKKWNMIGPSVCSMVCSIMIFPFHGCESLSQKQWDGETSKKRRHQQDPTWQTNMTKLETAHLGRFRYLERRSLSWIIRRLTTHLTDHHLMAALSFDIFPVAIRFHAKNVCRSARLFGQQTSCGVVNQDVGEWATKCGKMGTKCWSPTKFKGWHFGTRPMEVIVG